MLAYNSIHGFALGHSRFSGQVPPNEFHYHDDYEILYLRKGSREIFVRDKKYRVQSGNLLFIDKGTIHTSNAISDEYERFVINFTDDYIQPSIKERISPLFKQAIFAPDRTNDIDRLFFCMFEEWNKLREDDHIAAELLACYVNLLLSLFIRGGDKWKLAAAISNPAVERLVRCMNDNPHLPMTLADAAKMLNITPTYLSKIFAKYTGFGFSEYMKIIRVKKARTLLETTKLSVKEISCRCGFNDSNYFSTVFKNSTGHSPLHYRRAFRM